MEQSMTPNSYCSLLCPLAPLMVFKVEHRGTSSEARGQEPDCHTHREDGEAEPHTLRGKWAFLTCTKALPGPMP